MIERLLNQTDVTAVGYDSYLTEAMLCNPPKGTKRVCVAPQHILRARNMGFRVSAVVGFPFGTATARGVEECILNGAQELDIPLPVEVAARGVMIRPRIYTGSTQLGEWVKSLKIPAHPDITYKFILHTDLIQKIYGDDAILVIKSHGEVLKRVLGSIYRDGNLVLKLCSGYGPGKATPDVVEALVGEGYRVKASGGIRTAEQAEALFNAGAELLGIGYLSFNKMIKSLGEIDGSEAT